jgi:hypothetical protein
MSRRNRRTANAACVKSPKRVRITVSGSNIPFLNAYWIPHSGSSDSLRFYFLGANWQRRVEHVGAKPGYNPEGPLIL